MCDSITQLFFPIPRSKIWFFDSNSANANRQRSRTKGLVPVQCNTQMSSALEYLTNFTSWES